MSKLCNSGWMCIQLFLAFLISQQIAHMTLLIFYKLLKLPMCQNVYGKLYKVCSLLLKISNHIYSDFKRVDVTQNPSWMYVKIKLLGTLMSQQDVHITYWVNILYF